jgi:hypothetical protein
MARPTIILFRPETQGGHDLLIAEGMRAAWGCALRASGADVFMPNQPHDPGHDPLNGAKTANEAFAAIGGMRGDSLTHDGQPPTGRIDAIVLTRFVRGPGTLRVLVHILRLDAPMFVRGGRTFRGPTAELRAMATTLHTVARELRLDLPAEIGWRDLTRSTTAATGLADLVALGREDFRRATHGAPVPLH